MVHYIAAVSIVLLHVICDAPIINNIKLNGVTQRSSASEIIMIICKASESRHTHRHTDRRIAVDPPLTAVSLGHRTLYIGVHVPLGSTRHRSHRRHHHHGNKHRKRSRNTALTLVEGRESPVYGTGQNHGRACILRTKSIYAVVHYIFRT